VLRQIGFEPRRIEAQRLGDLLGSTEGDLAPILPRFVEPRA
jgi:hypothetical protein